MPASPRDSSLAASELSAEQTALRGGGGQTRDVASRPSDQLFLVLEGARPLAGGARWSLDGVDEVRMRRGSTRAATRERVDGRGILSIKLPDALMSSNHARLVRGPQGFTLVDDGSRNFTFVDGERITSRTLHDGATFEMGAAHFILRTGLSTPENSGEELESAGLLGASFGMASLLPAYAEELSDLARIAATELPIMLLGESGTGKEVLASAVHRLSGRAGPFVGVNCGALTPTLMESQLFGHVKGAFSGAVGDEPGFVRASHGGTLFLDEIGDLPAASQAALLRVLEMREVNPVGSTRTVPVDLRVVSATLKPESSLRPDLRARLAGFTHRLPPLRERIEDLGVVLAALLTRMAGPRASELTIEPEAGRALLAHDWPLNVRELSQALGVALALARGSSLERRHLPQSVLTGAAEPADPTGAEAVRTASTGDPEIAVDAPPPPVPAIPKDDASLRALVVATLEVHRGNISEVSRALGRTRMQIHRWMKRFEIDAEGFRR